MSERDELARELYEALDGLINDEETNYCPYLGDGDDLKEVLVDGLVNLKAVARHLLAAGYRKTKP